MEQELHPNAGKNDIIEVDGVRYQRLPIKTHLITDKDNILDVAEKYGKPVLSKPGDVLFISEKCVACTQRRAIPLADIKPRKLAYKLSAHVTKTPHGIGLGMPETMECALREVGTLRILFAAIPQLQPMLLGQAAYEMKQLIHGMNILNDHDQVPRVINNKQYQSDYRLFPCISQVGSR